MGELRICYPIMVLYSSRYAQLGLGETVGVWGRIVQCV